MGGIAVLGGGPAGVSLCASLARTTTSTIHLFEQRERLGGLHRSVRIDGRFFDIGPFFFEEDHHLVKCFPELKECLNRVDRTTRVLLPSSNIYTYPPSIPTFRREHGWTSLLAVATSLLRDRFKYNRDWNSAREYARYYLGDYFYRQSGLKRYMERLYRIKDKNIGSKFARQRLPKFEEKIKLENAIELLTGNVFKEDGEESSCRCLLTTPKRGFESVYDVIHENLKSLEVCVHLRSRVKNIRKISESYVLTTSRSKYEFEEVFSTIPIPVTLSLIGKNIDTKVDTVSLHSVFFLADSSSGWDVLYNYTENGMWKRLLKNDSTYSTSNSFNHFSVEITLSSADSKAKKRAWEEAKAHLHRHEVFDSSIQRVGAVTTENAYPVFRVGQEEEIQREVERIESFGIRTVGRQGQHDYISSSGASQHAKELVQE